MWLASVDAGNAISWDDQRRKLGVGRRDGRVAWGRAVLDFDRFQWLSFDCYGTLVDWETGISDAVADALSAHDMRVSRSDILALFAAVEPEIQQGGIYMEYRTVLRSVMAMMGTRLEIEFSEREENCLWTPLGRGRCPDSVEALRSMKSRYKLAVVTNVDDDLFAPAARAWA